ncbi:MAG: hypothetical protein FJ291_13245 [Planctomycetes bacterium]|nr:hypothetical protein [Planctomycetota bacterium]
MIEGHVTAHRQAVVCVRLYATTGMSEPADVTMDTGFTGFLALPPDLIARLGLPCLGLRTGFLADGREAVLNVFEAVVDWHGERRRVTALEVQRGGLLGMGILEGSHVAFDAIQNGPVQITPLK